MKRSEFLWLLNVCPICNIAMTVDRMTDILTFVCINHKLHYESYAFNGDDDNARIYHMTIQAGDFNIFWSEKTKQISLRDQYGKIVVEKVFPDKTAIDWLINPYKNIINKAGSYIMLS